MNAILTDQWDEDGEAAGVIRVVCAGSICDYPYDDSGERADQLRNARGDCEGFTVIDRTDHFIPRPQ
jgi:hypothetical protein